MKQKKLAPLLTISMCLEMILAPLPALAAEKKEISKQEKIDKVIKTTKDVAGVGTDIINTVRGIQGGGQPQGPVHLLEAQKAPLPDKIFNFPQLSKIPGLGDYLNNSRIHPERLQCSTMAATLSEVYMESCRLGVSSTSGIPPEIQIREMFDYHNSYLQIEKQYHNFSQTSNVDGQKFGIGCMDNAKKILEGFFDYRLNELSKLTASIEAINNQFKEAAKADLMAIEDATALLEGGNGRLANKVKTRNPDLLDFSKKFNNPACSSMFAANEFGKMGSSQGLNGILTNLKEEITTKPPGSKYTGESYANGHASVVNDIKNLSEKVATQMDLQFEALAASPNGYSAFLSQAQNLSSDNNLGKAISADLFSDVQTSFNKSRSQIQSVQNELQAELRLSPEAIRSLYDAKSDAVFETEVRAVENRIKNECIARAVSPADMAKRMHDPKRNKNAVNPMIGLVDAILKDQTTSLETKVSKIQELDKKYKSSYFMKMDSSYEVQYLTGDGKLASKKVAPSTKVTPGVYFTDMARNCEAQFKVNKIRSNTASGAISKLREVKKNYKALAQQQRNAVKEQIQKRMIECSDQNVANSSNIGSCRSDTFDTSSSSFCARAAMSCSQNMQQCTQQAEKMVEAIKVDRTSKVNKYKALVEKNKQDINKILDTALSRYMREGEMLRSAFGKGFDAPTELNRSVKDGTNFLPLFQEAGGLQLEDPEEYVKNLQNNIKKLAVNVGKQQDAIKREIDEHINTTEKNYSNVIAAAKSKASECLASYDRAVGENEMAAKARNESNQKVQADVSKFCRQYGIIADSPNPSCDPKVSDLATSVLDAVDTPESREASHDLRLACISYSNYKQLNGSEDEDEEYYQVTPPVDEICSTTDVKTAPFCRRRNELKLCQDKYSLNSASGLDSTECRKVGLEKLKDKNPGDFLETEIESLEAKISDKYTPRRVASSTKQEFKKARQAAIDNIRNNPNLPFCNAQNDSLVSPKTILETVLGQQGIQNPLAIGQ